MPRRKPLTVTVNDQMQRNYRYQLTEPVGRNFDSWFKPDLTPAEMLKAGVFGGRYLRDCQAEFPASWFKGVQFHPEGEPGHSPKLNFFGVDASQSLAEWERKGWVYPDDPRGWFQWYCRYYMGRRLPEEDDRQIKRWRQIRRHVAQLQANCRPGDWQCRPRQRQALLHWGYDSRNI